MRWSIKSLKFDKQLTFTRPGKEYIFVDWNGKPGTLGNQICENGELVGNTLSYSGASEEKFEAICRKWYRSALKKETRK